MVDAKDDLNALINKKIEAIRPRLLDLSRRNPLIATRLSIRSNSYIRVVDELPDVLFFNLMNSQQMRFVPLPSLEDEPQDEQTEAFLRALAKRAVQFTISRDKSDPSNGFIHYKTPIAEAILGAEEGDELEILVGSYLRPAILEKIVDRRGRSTHLN